MNLWRVLGSAQEVAGFRGGGHWPGHGRGFGHTLAALAGLHHQGLHRFRVRRLLDKVEELEKNVTQLTSKIVQLGGDRGGSSTSLLNPPPTPAPRDVYGTVMAVGTGGLTIISIGSDSGLSSGNKLLVYRVDAKNPKNSIYLGEMVVSRTEPKQAAGQFYPKPFAKPDERLPQVKDVVSTSLGSR